MDAKALPDIDRFEEVGLPTGYRRVEIDLEAGPDHATPLRAQAYMKAADQLPACLDRVASTGVAMELNTSGLNKTFPEMNPGIRMLRMMHARRIPVVIGSDSHTPRRVGANFDLALDALQEAGYQKVSFFSARKRQDVLIAEVRASLQAPALAGAVAE